MRSLQRRIARARRHAQVRQRSLHAEMRRVRPSRSKVQLLAVIRREIVQFHIKRGSRRPLFCVTICGVDTFRQRVLVAVSRISKGEVLTYKEVARRAGKPQAYRAVGNILKGNFDLRVPCHRVVRSDGKIGRYNKGARRKAELLEREGAAKNLPSTRGEGGSPPETDRPRAHASSGTEKSKSQK